MNVFTQSSMFGRFSVRESFTTKVLVAASAAALAPGLLLTGALLTGLISLSQPAAVLLVLVAFLASAGITAVCVRALLRPIEDLSRFLKIYLSTGEIAEFPHESDDDFGRLMTDVRDTVLRFDLSKKELAEAGKVDVLTGLHNRRFSAQRLQQDLARANRARTAVSLIAVDIDDFRRINDKMGSAVGDACLRHFAGLAKSCIREGDWIARWGGDEFLILLWDADARHAEAVINRIRQKLAKSQEAIEAGIRLTASFGYTTHSPGDLNFELFTKADSALSRAKRLGKNQTAGPIGLGSLS